MIWIVIAIIVAALIIATATNRGSRQKRIDDWYENLPEDKKRKYEMPTDAIIDENVAEGFHSDAKKIKKLKAEGKSVAEIAKEIDMDEQYIRNLQKSNIYKNQT